MNLLNNSWLLTLKIAFVFFCLSLIVFALNMNDEQGLVSSVRILVSILIWPILLKNIKIKVLIKFIFYFSLINGVLAILQFYDAIISEILPEFLKYGYLYGFESVEPFRQGGIVNGLQVSSLLALISSFIGVKYKIKYSIIWFCINIFVLLIGSRSLLVFSTFFLAYFFIKKPFKSSIILIILISVITSVNNFDDYLNQRIVPAFTVFATMDVSNDYSAQDTYSHYKLPKSVKELLIGNGFHRYSKYGGGDPFFSRWLLQSGLIVTTILLILLLVLFYPIIKSNLVLGVSFSLIFLITSLKGELITAFGIFDLVVIFRFIIFPKLIQTQERSQNTMSF